MPPATPLRAIEGTRDYFADTGFRYAAALSTAATLFARYGYESIVTPIFEDTRLFSRSIGETTDIVEKEMYTFTPGSDTITLRPEGTAGVIRAYLQHGMHKQGGLRKLRYAGPMFRRERPQKGRQRQFHQVGVEAIGSADPVLDAEVIEMGLAYYRALGIGEVRTRLNSIGCPQEDCRPAYRRRLREAVEPQLGSFCKTCQARFSRNILRILDCKNPTCQELTASLPASADHLCHACDTHFAAVRSTLDTLGVAYAVDARLVRGLDYYTQTVFEYTHSALGAQDAIGGGGRYDGLVEELGGPPTPAVGFALGVERIMIALETLDLQVEEPRIDLFGVALGEAAHARMAGLLREARADGRTADMDFEARSMKAQMRAANRRGARVVWILGDEELAAGTVQVKDMREGGGQETLPFPDALAALGTLLPPPGSDPAHTG